MSKRVGIEIGTNKTKIIVGNYSKNEYKVTGYEIIDTVDGVYTIDGDSDILRMEIPIREALDRLGVKSDDLFVSMTNEKVIIRTRELPRVSPKDMKEVVSFEAENFLPYDINEFNVDYKILSESEETNTVNRDNKKETLFNVMIIAAPKAVVNQYIDLASKLKLKMKIATVYTESVSKYFEKNLLDENKNMLFVDLGNSYTNMIMFQGMQYFANIKADIGIQDVQEKLIDVHGFNERDVMLNLFSQYDKNLETKVYTDKDKLEIFKTSLSDKKLNTIDDDKLHMLQKKLEKIRKVKNSFNAPESELIRNRNSEYSLIISEISRMIEFFKSRKYGTFVDKIYLFGGGAYLNDFLEFLSEELGISCSIVPDVENYTTLNKEHFQVLLSTLGSCIGGKS